MAFSWLSNVNTLTGAYVAALILLWLYLVPATAVTASLFKNRRCHNEEVERNQ